jgi:phenylalanyl-tRNA synthetase beta chain
MLVPLSWLRDFAPFEGDPAALAETFDDLGMVVEGVTRVGEGLGGVVVARVEAIEPIAGADRIRKVTVDAGGADTVGVVCGAWNFAVGDLVPLAPVGTVLPGDFEITRRKMKGVVSDGMLCSPVELRLGADGGGLMVLPPHLGVGAPLAEALGIQPDVVYDLAIEGNRPDAMCMAGVARDAAAKLRLPFAIPEPPPVAAAGNGSAPPVVVEAPQLSPRFSATVFPAAPAAPSPAWMGRRLTMAGMRPISGLVDVSNYVMLELGQPTHPYDRDKLAGGGLSVRAARPGETVTTLDGVERTLGDGPYPDCLICDADGGAVGIAGIMGGATTEIDGGTTTVLLEAAYFDPMAIARTSKRLGLRSEASARFERGCDPEGIERAVARYAELAGLTAGGAATVGSAPPRPRIRVRTARVNAILGTDLDEGQVRSYLAPIGFTAVAAPEGGGVHDVTPPSFRPDAQQEIDVIEEVARHHGYANITRTVPGTARAGGLTTYQRERRQVREVMVGAGFSEAVTSMLVAPGDHERSGLPEGPGAVIEADSPLAREESVLRTSLLPGLLRALAFNASHQRPDVSLFEIGHVFPPSPDGGGLPAEREVLAAVVAGTGAGATEAVQAWRTLRQGLRLEGVELEAAPVAGAHPTRAARLVLSGSGRPLGAVGEVDPAAVAAHGLDGRVGVLWAELEPLLSEAPRRPLELRPASRFPASEVDLAFVVEDAVPAAAVESTLRRAAGELGEEVRLFDVYRSPILGPGRRSLAFRLRFRAMDHTMTDAEVAQARHRCIVAVESAHRAQLRG